MIEMPANRTAQTAAPSGAVTEAAPDAPDGAFAEMLSRNLGRGLVRRPNLDSREAEQDAARGGNQGEAQFYRGAAVTAWAPAAVPAPTGPAAAPIVAEPDPTAVGGVMTPASQAVAARVGLVAPPGNLSGDPTAAAATEPDTEVAATTAPAGRTSIEPQPRRIADPWQAPPPQGAAPRVADPHAAKSQVTGHSPLSSPSVIGEPSSGSGLMDSPRLETTAATTAGTAGVPAGGRTADMAGPAAPSPLGAPPMASGPVDPPAAGTGTVERSVRPTLEVAEPGPPQAGTTESGGTDAATGATSAAQAPPPMRPVATPNPQLVNRVLRMVEFQQTQPPPRMVVVDMPELEGLRLMVAVQADGKVHVAPIAGSAPHQVAEPFMQAVGQALSAEGFDLAAGSQERERRHRPETADPAPTGRRAPRRRRSPGLRL